MCTGILIFCASFNIQGLIANIIQNAKSINEVITKMYYPAGLYINLIQDFNILDLAILLAINIIPAIVFVYVASIFYFKITSKLGEKTNNSKKVNLKKASDKIFKVKSQLFGLINKEMKRFFSSPVFIINAGFGMVLMVVITIAISINFDGFVSGFLEQGQEEIEIGVKKRIAPKAENKTEDEPFVQMAEDLFDEGQLKIMEE